MIALATKLMIRLAFPRKVFVNLLRYRSSRLQQNKLFSTLRLLKHEHNTV